MPLLSELSRLAWHGRRPSALVGTMVRRYESYLLGPDIGPYPRQPDTSRGVLVMFCWMTKPIFYLLTDERHCDARALAALQMLVVSSGRGLSAWFALVLPGPARFSPGARLSRAGG